MKAVEPQQAGLYPKPAVCEPVVALDGAHHGFDGGARYLIAQVRGVHGIVVVAKAVHCQAITHQGVVAVCEGGRIGPQGGVQRLKRTHAKVPIGVAYACQQAVDGVGLCAVARIEIGLERGGDATEKALPRAGGSGAALTQHALLGLAQHVPLEPALGQQVVAVASDFRGVRQLIGQGIVELEPFQFEEPQRIGGLHHRAVHQRVEILVLGVRYVHGFAKRGVRVQAAEFILDAAQLGKRVGEGCAVECGNLPPVTRFECSAVVNRSGKSRTAVVGGSGKRGEVPVDALGTRSGISRRHAGDVTAAPQPADGQRYRPAGADRPSPLHGVGLWGGGSRSPPTR